MRSLSDTLLQLFTQGLILSLKLGDSVFQQCQLFMPNIIDQLKVLYSIVILDMVFVMHYFPRMETSPKMPRHNKAVFQDYTCSFSHRIKKVIRLQLNKYITSPTFVSTTFPARVFTPTIMRWFGFLSIRTRQTQVMYRFSIFQQNPSFFATLLTSLPYITIGGANITKFFTPSYFTYLKHMTIIPHNRQIVNGVV